MAYTPPKHILEVLSKIEYEQALPAGDERYVETQAARGSEKTFARLARKLGWDSNAFFAPGQRHVLFFGHRGSGKTTELLHHATVLDRSKHFYVVPVDASVKLDRNNLHYSDALMAMAESLLEKLQADGHAIADAELEPLRQWFAHAISTRTEARELNAEIKTRLKAGVGIAGLIGLFTTFTSAFKTGASVKNEWREEIRNTFTKLAAAFNGLIRSAEAALTAAGRAERVVFLIDGTDKLGGADTRRFFIEDAKQLLAIEAMVIYGAPLYLMYEHTFVGELDADLVLPMIKLEERDGTRCAVGWATLRKLLLLRADRSLFASDAEIDRLIAMSGGHPRELLHLLKLCCEYADDGIDGPTVERAIKQLASEYRRALEPEDYALLRRLDADAVHAGNDERTRRLLYNLALLEYNDGSWRRSHPVIRALEGYLLAPPATPAPAPEPAA